MKIIGISGWSGNGKTTLLDKLIPELTRRGQTVSTLKHAHHNFDIDHPGKDSHRHREAGAKEVLISSSNRWALMHEHKNNMETPFDELISKMSPVDILLIEGFKTENFPKIEIWREAVASEFIYLNDNSVVAIAADIKIADSPIPVLDLNDANEIAEFILSFAETATPIRAGE